MLVSLGLIIHVILGHLTPCFGGKLWVLIMNLVLSGCCFYHCAPSPSLATAGHWHAASVTYNSLRSSIWSELLLLTLLLTSGLLILVWSVLRISVPTFSGLHRCIDSPYKATRNTMGMAWQRVTLRWVSDFTVDVWWPPWSALGLPLGHHCSHFYFQVFLPLGFAFLEGLFLRFSWALGPICLISAVVYSLNHT